MSNCDPNCSPHPADLVDNCCTNADSQFRSTKKWVSCYPEWGPKNCVEGSGYAISDVSQQDADQKALEIAQDDAAKRLRIKLGIQAALNHYFVSEDETYKLVAPNGTGDRDNKWEGSIIRKPWEYDVTVAIPHLETLEPLLTVIETLRAQTMRPYIIIVDTGSSPQVKKNLESFRAQDVEIHYLMSNSWQHSSEPVTAALDLAQSICKTDHLFHTHSDVFLRRFDLLESWVRLVNEKTPVVGYRMSPRNWVTNDWEWMVGHTVTMVHMPTMHKIGATWSMQRMNKIYGYEWSTTKGGWPDTEVGFNCALKEQGIEPVFLGYDRNYERQIDDNIDHARSFPGTQMYAKGMPIHEKARKYMMEAIDAANIRLLRLKEQSLVRPSHRNHSCTFVAP